MLVMVKKIIEVTMEDNFKCKCGNTASQDGFYPCNKEGETIEPTPEWEDYYKCEGCIKIYKQTNF
jgi:hypothetical protein